MEPTATIETARALSEAGGGNLTYIIVAGIMTVLASAVAPFLSYRMNKAKLRAELAKEYEEKHSILTTALQEQEARLRSALLEEIERIRRANKNCEDEREAEYTKYKTFRRAHDEDYTALYRRNLDLQTRFDEMVATLCRHGIKIDLPELPPMSPRPIAELEFEAAPITGA